MSDETLNITNNSSEDATINLLKFDANRISNNQRILSILSLLLCFVADDINDDDNCCPSRSNIIQQIQVVRLATAILRQKIGGKKFRQIFLLVDGIYPELARFVKSFQEPISKSKIYYSKWQEG